MKNIILLVSLVLMENAFADYQIIQLNENTDNLSLYLDNGEIVELDKENQELVDKVRDAFKTESLISIVKISNSENHPDIIADIKLMPVPSEELPTKEYEPLEEQELTLLSTYDEAQSLMDTFNGKTDDDSQCYNRAHMWTYEAQSLHNVNLGKVWIYFTRKYIREYDYKWWFHVAPFAKVNDGNGRYVVDRGFTMVPYNLTNWKNIFIKSQAECPVITDYRQYERNQWAHHCYLMFSSQYYWQPQHLERLAKRDITQYKYKSNDLRITYTDALIYWNGYIPDQRNYPEPGPAPTPTPEIPRRSTPSEIDRPVSVGEWIISPNGVDGKITKVFGGGNVRVKYVSMADEILQHTRDLALRRGVSVGYRVGTRVISRNGIKGEVSGVYADGRLAVRYVGMQDHTPEYPENLRLR